MHALDPSFDVMRWIFVALGILFVVIGAVLGRIPPNGLAGIRTPWTLADEGVWARTHRFTGRLMTLGGVALAAVATLGADHIDLVVALVVCILGPALAGVIYSRAIAGGPGDSAAAASRAAWPWRAISDPSGSAPGGSIRRAACSSATAARRRGWSRKLMDLLLLFAGSGGRVLSQGRDRRGGVGRPRHRRRHAGRRDQPPAPRARRDARAPLHRDLAEARLPGGVADEAPTPAAAPAAAAGPAEAEALVAQGRRRARPRRCRPASPRRGSTSRKRCARRRARHRPTRGSPTR